MTDIIERSKQCPAVCDCDGEACLLYELRAEIERLRSEHESYVEWTQANLAPNAEIERLTAREEQRAERLRLYMNRIGELEADNERLRAALQEIEDFPYVGTQASQKIRGIARRAREPKL